MMFPILVLILRLSNLDIDNCCSIEASCAAHPTADVFINFASYRRSVLIFVSGTFEVSTLVVVLDDEYMLMYLQCCCVFIDCSEAANHQSSGNHC